MNYFWYWYSILAEQERETQRLLAQFDKALSDYLKGDSK